MSFLNKQGVADRLETAAKARSEQESAGRGHTTDRPTSRSRPRSRAKEKAVVEEVLTSTTARQLGRTAVREIFRGLFKTGRR